MTVASLLEEYSSNDGPALFPGNDFDGVGTLFPVRIAHRPRSPTPPDRARFIITVGTRT